jgi:hypothetical protein
MFWASAIPEGYEILESPGGRRDRRLESPTELVDGDHIRVGSIELKFTAIRARGSTRTEPRRDN